MVKEHGTRKQELLEAQTALSRYAAEHQSLQSDSQSTDLFQFSLRQWKRKYSTSTFFAPGTIGWLKAMGDAEPR